jgi:hypothetical protein
MVASSTTLVLHAGHLSISDLFVNEMAVQEIGFYGGMALLISSITGPGLTTSSSSDTFAIAILKLIISKFLSYSKRQDGLRSY